MVLLRQELTSKKIQKTKLIYISVLWTAFFAVLITVLLLYFFAAKPIFSLISFIVVWFFLVLVLVFKIKITVLNLKQKNLRLKETKVSPFLVKKTFFNELQGALLLNDFMLVTTTLGFDLYLKESAQNRGIELVCRIKKPNFEFLSPEIDIEIKKILKFFGQRTVSHIICLIFKKYTEYSNQAETEADNIVTFSNWGVYFTSINIAYFEKESTLYFLHSKTFWPSNYYKVATESILNLTK